MPSTLSDKSLIFSLTDYRLITRMGDTWVRSQGSGKSRENSPRQSGGLCSYIVVLVKNLIMLHLYGIIFGLFTWLNKLPCHVATSAEAHSPSSWGREAAAPSTW